MSGTRRLEKYDPERPTAQESGTRRLEKFEPPRPTMVSISTPVAGISLATLAAATPSSPPEAVDVERPRASTALRAMDREPAVEILRTRLARKFTTLADEVSESFAEFRIGAGAWQPELTAPEGMSTCGGAQAVQHLRLRPTRQGHPVLIGGLVNPVTNSAELRDHQHMVALRQARFGAAADLGITCDEWEQFLRKTEVVLRAEGFVARRVPAPRDLRRRARRESRLPWRALAFVALGIIAPLAVLVMWRVAVVLLR
ncbi:hypothetical protein BH11MYX4_BH11MYX4_22460 [soil metagenome]